jgi:hypothetical protein
MKKIASIAICSLILSSAGAALSMDQGSDHSTHGAMTQATGSDHAAMQHGSGHEGGTYKHAAMVDGIHAEFQVMDLAAMKMKDPEGRTHHIMVSFTKDGVKIDKAVGKVKVIAPSGKEQIGDLQDFGSGVFAANFTFDEAGKWGVICLFKDAAGKHTVKFWYPHQAM